LKKRTKKLLSISGRHGVHPSWFDAVANKQKLFASFFQKRSPSLSVLVLALLSPAC
jgi:hypothetical protein